MRTADWYSGVWPRRTWKPSGTPETPDRRAWTYRDDILVHNRSGYNRGCRCADCHQAMLDYQRSRRAERKKAVV